MFSVSFIYLTILFLPSYSGEVGDWANHFTPEQSKMFDEDYAKQMKGTDIPFRTHI